MKNAVRHQSPGAASTATSTSASTPSSSSPLTKIFVVETVGLQGKDTAARGRAVRVGSKKTRLRCKDSPRLFVNGEKTGGRSSASGSDGTVVSKSSGIFYTCSEIGGG